jgi:hypothetical protein
MGGQLCPCGLSSWAECCIMQFIIHSLGTFAECWAGGIGIQFKNW